MALNLDPSKKFGTLEEQVLALAAAFRARSGLLVPAFNGGLGPEAASGYRQADLRAVSLDLSRFTPGRLARLLRVIRREHIELVQWHFYEPLANPYLWALGALAPRVRHVYTDHISRPSGTAAAATASGWKAALKRRLLRRYEAALCVSDFVSDDLEAQGTWPALRRVTHFVNTRRFAPDPAVREATRLALGERPDRFVALAVAYLIPEKGIDVAIRATAALPESAALWVAGHGPEAGALAELAGSLGVSERVRFLGLQRHVEPFLQAADVFVCPSVWAEAAGLVNIEAMAAGLPVVASAVGGIPEIVSDGRTGFLVPSGDPNALADRLRRLIDDSWTRLELGRQARADALARFSAEALIPEYLDLYRELARPGPRRLALARNG
jgi:glycosyltransferase involved in cell wall biosynthesis